jgi:hypothetical protein
VSSLLAWSRTSACKEPPEPIRTTRGNEGIRATSFSVLFAHNLIHYNLFQKASTPRVAEAVYFPRDGLAYKVSCFLQSWEIRRRCA